MELIIDNIIVDKRQNRILNTGRLNLGSKGMVGLIGPNGAGKSTLLKVICGIEKAGAGKVYFNGRCLSDLDNYDRSQLIGYIPQYFQPCWNQKTIELLQLASERTDSPLKNFNKVMGTFELKDLLYRNWESLSGGERSRVSLAMALTGDPPVILADEPGAAMDIGHNLQMLETFKKRSYDSLVLVCLHDLNLALRYFKTLIILHDGRVAYIGPPQELLNSSILDDVFKVDFFKVETEVGWLIQASNGHRD